MDGHAAILLSICICICICLPTAQSQATTDSSSINGREFVTYSFPSFEKSLLNAPNLTMTGNATINQRALQITPDSSNNPDLFLANQSGRVFFSTPFPLWSLNTTTNTTYVASFSTVFKINIFRLNTSIPGEGLAFLISPDRDLPPPNADAGYLGLTNSTTDGNSTNRFVAVELDTVKQPYDPDNNHVGLDINGVRSVSAASLTPLGIQLGAVNASNNMVWIDYNGTSRHIWVYVAKEGDPKPASAVLDASLDLSAIIPETAYFGFSASTGVQYELNCVLMWNITVERLEGSGGGKGVPGWKLGLMIGIPCAFVAVVGGLLAGLCVRKRRKKVGLGVGADPRAVFGSSTIDLRSLPGIPKEFEYRELRKGTNNFDDRMKLGQGGYGVVYRAIVVGDGGQSMEVAVKQFSGANTKGQEDFLAELGIINRLRHRNLVKLLGWCHQNGVLLLVYDYMPNGSLDKHLFGGPEAPILDWKQRYNIVTGVAAALNYLHHEYDQMVIHRDIKPSNIMLDSAFNARLGDFGLARALESDKTSYTDKIGVPGTLGYIAPECFHTGRATRESDVFGFGAVILEIVCGRRISCSNPAGSSQLLEWVWKLHGACRIIEAVDQRLGGDYDEDDAERLLLLGLACSHPNPGERPKAQTIVQIMSRSVPMSAVPTSKPVFMWPVLPDVRSDDNDGETMSYSGMSSTVVTSSYYASSAGWTGNQTTCKDHTMADKDVSMV